MKTLRSWLKVEQFLTLFLAVLASRTEVLAQTIDSNVPPAVAINSPTNGEAFFAPTNIQMVAVTSYASGPTNVEFFAGTNDLGAGILEVSSGFSGIWYFTWTNPPPGDYTLTASGMTSGGMAVTSAPVNITVLQGPATNLPPVVRIVSPPDGAVFYAPVDIPLVAYVNSGPKFSTGPVQFFDGTNSIGFGQPIPPPVAAVPAGSSNSVPPISTTNLFFLVWSNAPVGNHVLTAHAVIVGKLFTLAALIVSPPVDIIVLPPQPPPTNTPPIVDIVASDPVAIAGTNCWLWPGETNSPPTWAAWPPSPCCYLTNYGPKTATFTVRRFGETNDDLTVTYDIGGTASNGVDYIALPGYVTIPAAERRAFITIVPIYNPSPDAVKTVILTLTPSTNAPPDYLIGYPPRAAAIIVESPGPRPVTGLLPDKCFHLSMPGPDAAWFCIERSADLVNWTPICTNQVVNGSIDFIDPDASVNANQFYRAVPVTNTPAE